MPNVSCPFCDHSFEASDSLEGMGVTCAACGKGFLIPTAHPLKKMKTPTILSLLALILAMISLLMQFRVVGGVPLKFETPEEAIKTLARLNRDARYADVREAKKIMQAEAIWEFADPDGIEVVKTLEVRGTGDASADGGALCFLRFTKGDGVTSHEVVLLTKNSRGMFSPDPISSRVRDEYGSIMAAWEKNGILK